MSPGGWIRDRRILITGGHGFLGSFVRELLQSQRPAEVIAPRRSEFDLIDRSDVDTLLAATRPEVVIHLAAEVGGIGANESNPGRYFYANLSMGLNLIEASRIANVQKFLQLGTVCSYPKFTPVPFKESDLWNGFPEETNAPYGIAKRSLLVMLNAYRKQYDFNGIYLLPVNLYGPRDNFDPETSHVIPALIRKFVEAREMGSDMVEVWGSGAPSREFLYVEDAAHGILQALDSYNGTEPVNLGSGDEITISELSQMICDLVGFEGQIAFNSEFPDGQPRRRLDTARAQALFGFSPKVALRDGLRQTIAWWEHEMSQQKSVG